MYLVAQSVNAGGHVHVAVAVKVHADDHVNVNVNVNVNEYVGLVRYGRNCRDPARIQRRIRRGGGRGYLFRLSRSSRRAGSDCSASARTVRSSARWGSVSEPVATARSTS